MRGTCVAHDARRQHTRPSGRPFRLLAGLVGRPAAQRNVATELAARFPRRRADGLVGSARGRPGTHCQEILLDPLVSFAGHTPQCDSVSSKPTTLQYRNKHNVWLACSGKTVRAWKGIGWSEMEDVESELSYFYLYRNPHFQFNVRIPKQVLINNL